MGKLPPLSGPGFAFLLVAALSAVDAHAAAPPPRALTLDEVLSRWAKSRDSIRSMRCRFTRTEIDRNFGSRTTTKGEVRLIRPDLLRIDHDTPQGLSTILFTKDHIHSYNPANKTEMIFPKPEDRSFLGEKTNREPTWKRFLSCVWVEEMFQQRVYWLYGGLPVQELSRRFDLRLVKEDAWYIYLDLVPPKSARHEFNRMRVVLPRTNLRVRLIWYEEPNGNEVTLDFEKVEANPKMTPENIREGLPKDWKRIRLPKVEGQPDTRTKE